MPGAAGCPCWSRPSHHHWPSKVGGPDTSARNSRPEGHAIAMDTRWPGSSNAQCTLGHPPCSTSIHIRSGLQWGTAAVLGLPGLPPSATGCHSPRAFRVQAHPSRCHHHGPTNVSLQATSRRGSNPDEGSLNRNCPPAFPSALQSSTGQSAGLAQNDRMRPHRLADAGPRTRPRERPWPAWGPGARPR